MSADDFRWICPVTQHPCTRDEACRLTEETGRTMCAEWVLKQQQIGLAKQQRDLAKAQAEQTPKLKW